MGPEDNPADEQQPTKEEWEAYERERGQSPGEVRKQSMLYELCPVCGGEDGHLTCLHCVLRGVVPTGATAAQLSSLASLDLLRQESGISAAMLRDGRASGLIEAGVNLRDAVTLVIRLARCLPEDHQVRKQALDWIDRKGLTPSPLRGPVPGPPNPPRPDNWTEVG